MYRTLMLLVSLFVLYSTAIMTPAETTAQSGWYGEIQQAADYYGKPYLADQMYQVMLCESGGNPQAQNPVTGDYGLFQYNAATYAAFGGTDITDPHEQIRVTAWAFANGYQSRWVCWNQLYG